MSNSVFQLNQRISNLYGLVGQPSGGVPTSSNLSDVLANGNDATNQSILNVNDIDVVTINGSAYPPVVPADTLQAVVNAGNGISNFTPGSTASITSTNFTNNRQLLLNANADPTIKMVDNLNASHYTTFDIDTINLSGTTTNWSSIVATPTLDQVLTAGNTATNKIILNNGATNVITTDPSLNTIVLTDGTTTNTINTSGYTTRNSVQNITHYLNFSDSSSTGTGAIQKTAGLSCNPSTNTITATTFSGDLSGNASTATNITGGLGGQVLYQSAVNTTAKIANGTSGQYLKSNGTTLAPSWATLPVVNDGTLQINNGTHITGSGTFTANQLGNTTITIATDATSSNTASTLITRDASGNFSAGTITASLNGNATTATTATNIAGGLGGSVPYQSAVNTTALLANGTAGQVLTSQGTTLAPTWTTISAGSNASTINITDTPTTAGTYYPTFVSSAGSTQTLRADTQYLQYNPSTNVLQNPSFLVSNGTETAGDSGLVIGGAGSNVKTFLTNKPTLGATQTAMSFTTSMTGTTSSVMSMYSPSSTLNGSFQVICYNKPSDYMTNQILLEPDYTNVASKGIKIEQNYVVGGENALLTGFTTKNNLSSIYADYEGTGEESRIDVNYDNVSIKSGTTGSPTEIVKITTNGLNVKNSVNNYTFVATTLTLNFQSVSFRNFYNSTAITTAITQSAIAFSNAVAGGSYMVYITTGVGGSFTFNTGITGVKTTFSSAFTIPASSVAVMNIYYINSVYIVGINILT